jgi:hypothetical protein
VALKYLRPGMAGEHSALLKRLPLATDVPAPAGVKMLTPGR